MTYAQGPHVTYEIFFLFFNVFEIYVKVFVHNEIYTDSVVTYLTLAVSTRPILLAFTRWHLLLRYC